jgi:arylsulfate sulfotransferase
MAEWSMRLFYDGKTSLTVILLTGLAACGGSDGTPPLGESLGLSAANIQLDPNGTSPLSAELEFTAPVAGVATVTVEGKGIDGVPIAHTFGAAATAFKVPVLGLYSNYINRIVVEFDAGSQGSTRDVIEIATAPLANPPQVEIISNDLPADDSSVYLFANQQIAFDQRGEVRWVFTGDAFQIFRKLADGSFLASVAEAPIRYHTPKFAAYSMLGEKLNEYAVPNYMHHDVRQLPWGNYLVAGNSSLIDFDTNGVPEEDIVVEIDAESGSVVKTWDFNLILDPARPTFPDNSRPDDWLHINSVVYDSFDDSIIITGRSQSVVAKVDYETGDLRWILAEPELWPLMLADKLLTPVDSDGDPVDPTSVDFWPYGMHAALVRSADHVAVYDNGNYRGWYRDDTVPPVSYSRAVEYYVDSNAMTVELKWVYDAGKQFYTATTGDVDALDNGNWLVGFAAQTPDTPRVVELEGDTVVFEAVSNRGTQDYRVEKIDLYSGL